MVDAASKALFNTLAKSKPLKLLASRHGMSKPTSFARRFVAGESVAEAIEAARVVEGRGLMQTLDHLGESVSSLDEAAAATRDYLAIIEAGVAAGIGRNLSLKLTQLGLDVDRASCVDNLRKVLERAQLHGFFVRIDMESSAYTEMTLDIFETLWRHDYHQMGVVLQAELYRSSQDMRRIMALGARIRLVKGAYLESKHVAYQSKADVNANYARMMRELIVKGTYPAIATHDPVMIDMAREIAREHQIAADRFEFQMLYGVRRDLQTALAAEGYRVRIYIPFGTEWFPYVMRRLGERPANVGFVLRSLVRG